jgi:hypothetical protein
MERFEIIIRAEGTTSIWIALFAVALLCAAIVAVAALLRFMPRRRLRRRQPSVPTLQQTLELPPSAARSPDQRTTDQPAN